MSRRSRTRAPFLDTAKAMRASMDAVLGQKVRASTWAVAVALWRDMGTYSRVSDAISRDRLAELSGYAPRTVSDALTELARCGAVVRIEHQGWSEFVLPSSSVEQPVCSAPEQQERSTPEQGQCSAPEQSDCSHTEEGDTEEGKTEAAPADALSTAAGTAPVDASPSVAGAADVPRLEVINEMGPDPDPSPVDEHWWAREFIESTFRVLVERYGCQPLDTLSAEQAAKVEQAERELAPLLVDDDGIEFVAENWEGRDGNLPKSLRDPAAFVLARVVSTKKQAAEVAENLARRRAT